MGGLVHPDPDHYPDPIFSPHQRLFQVDVRPSGHTDLAVVEYSEEHDRQQGKIPPRQDWDKPARARWISKNLPRGPRGWFYRSTLALLQQNARTLPFLINVVSGPNSRDTSHPNKRSVWP